MAKKYFPVDLPQQAASIQDAWARIDSKMTLGKVSLTNLATDINTLRGIEADMVALENQMTALRDQRQAVQQATWDKLKSARAMIKVIYGDDSMEYELMGGTRRSDRKSSRRTPAATQ
jgi:ATP-dependent 26S proteasome regulatory subunit